jgi:hypothetical protein
VEQFRPKNNPRQDALLPPAGASAYISAQTKFQPNRFFHIFPTQLIPLQVLERLQLRLEKRMELLQRVKLGSHAVFIRELKRKWITCADRLGTWKNDRSRISYSSGCSSSSTAHVSSAGCSKSTTQRLVDAVFYDFINLASRISLAGFFLCTLACSREWMA